jgi:hypothetical protein
VATATGAEARSPTKVACTLHLQALVVPGAAHPGEDFGTLACARPFGKGVQHAYSITVAPTSDTTGTATGRFQQFFDTGRIQGTFTWTFNADATGVVTSSGSVRISGGTDTYQHVRGSGTVACSSQDGGRHTTCTEKMTLTHG